MWKFWMTDAHTGMLAHPIDISSFSSVLQAGRHSIRVKAWTQSGSAATFHYGVSQGNQGTFIGRRIQVWDRGVAQ